MRTRIATAAVILASHGAAQAVPIHFEYHAPMAASVSVRGAFNAWGEDAMADSDGDGLWTLERALPAGTHTYKLFIDGTSWIADPSNPVRVGAQGDSQLIVGAATVYAARPFDGARVLRGADTAIEARLAWADADPISTSTLTLEVDGSAIADPSRCLRADRLLRWPAASLEPGSHSYRIAFRTAGGAAGSASATFTLVGGSEGCEAFLAGSDISFVTEYEAAGIAFKQGGAAADLYDILRRNGHNIIRLRVWHTPAEGWNNRADTIAKAVRTKHAGMKLLVDFHYSDWWADPSNQTPPAAWTGFTHDQLREAVRIHTRDTIAALRGAEATPDMVQIGNEIDPGMLWDDGRVNGAFDTPAQWTKLAELLKSGISGVDEALGAGHATRIMIHVSTGGNAAGSERFFTELRNRSVPFDVIGLSYYPWWQGPPENLTTNMDNLATVFDKDIVVVETAYPWTLAGFDESNNVVGEVGQLLPGGPATPEVQRRYLAEIFRRVRATRNGRGIGVIYWAPENIAGPGVTSAWENLALFDNQGEALPALVAFGPPCPNSSIWQVK